jgi:glycine hydroxymethyltransferase
MYRLIHGVKMMGVGRISGRRLSMSASLSIADPEMHALIEKEERRQRAAINLIASENYTSTACREAVGSVLCNKYSEGNVGRRYYAGNAIIDEVEQLCIDRALACFKLDPNEWGVNVQSLSGTPANFQVYTALLKPHDRLMGLHLPDGGHLSHGFSTPKKPISSTSLFFESRPYYVHPTTERIDYDALETDATQFRPKLIVAGSSAYSRKIDYERFDHICKKTNAYLLADMAHISGLVAAECLPSPFEYADVVTTTTHKSLRGPRGALIFYRKPFESAINFSVFPGMQGGPHNHTIAAIGVALKAASTPAFQTYQQNVIQNAECLTTALKKRGYRIVSDGTDMHMFVMDLSCELDINGAMVERVLEVVGIIANKNTVKGDKNAWTPHGIRIGTGAITTRGYIDSDMHELADLIDRGIRLVYMIVTQHRYAVVTMSGFQTILSSLMIRRHHPLTSLICELQKDVSAFSRRVEKRGMKQLTVVNDV